MAEGCLKAGRLGVPPDPLRTSSVDRAQGMGFLVRLPSLFSVVDVSPELDLGARDRGGVNQR